MAGNHSMHHLVVPVRVAFLLIMPFPALRRELLIIQHKKPETLLQICCPSSAIHVNSMTCLGYLGGLSYVSGKKWQVFVSLEGFIYMYTLHGCVKAIPTWRVWCTYKHMYVVKTCLYTHIPVIFLMSLLNGVVSSCLWSRERFLRLSFQHSELVIISAIGLKIQHY